jgi:hypothetical protein
MIWKIPLKIPITMIWKIPLKIPNYLFMYVINSNLNNILIERHLKEANNMNIT